MSKYLRNGLYNLNNNPRGGREHLDDAFIKIEVKQVLFAKSGDGNFIERVIHSNFSGFVHSTFKRSVNIHCVEDGELYTIACREIDNGPNTLILDVESLESMDIEMYDQVYTTSKSICIGKKITIETGKATIWGKKLPQYPLNTDVIKTNITYMKQYINMHGTSGGMKSPLSHISPFEHEMARIICERSNFLLAELLNKRMQHAVQHAVSLVGLGPGLTPSGDDFLVGLFTAFHLANSPLSSYKWFCEEVEKVAKELTNEISFMAIKQASTGQVRESIVSLLEAILSDDERELIISLQKVLNIGSSSGTDIALGILAGLETNIILGGI